MARLTIRLLGPFHVTLDGKPITNFESNKVRALLACLAMEPHYPHSREMLAGLLWPDQPEQTARHNLRQALSNLRQALGDRDADPPFLHITRGTVQFNLHSDHQLDVSQFEALVAASEAHAHAHLETCKPCIRQLEEAVKLYRGEFLEGLFVGDSVSFEEWALLRRERLHRLALDKLYHLAHHYERQRKYDRARRYARRQVELEPWREEAHQQLMRLLARSGQRSTALAQYERCRRILAKELGVEPDEQTQTLYERIRAARSSCSHNLPTQLTPFFGRKEDLAEIAERLENPACRLLTLVGPGGIGKTRLALQAAAEQVGGFLNGVFFVPLAAVSSTRFLAATIADAVGLVFSGEQDPQVQLLNYVRGKEMLLMLDNFEHLLPPTPLDPAQNRGDEDERSGELLVTILTQAPCVKVMATSREPLHLRPEWIFQVRGLAVPEPETAAELETYSAIQLFAETARRVDAGFELSGGTAPAAIRICQLVEGMPLGIELAAAAVRVYPCEQIADGIEHNLDFLTTSMRDVPRRHKSLRAVFEHSWGLLTTQEQTVFSQLSVFPDRFTLEAASAVIGQEALTPERYLVALADHSLIQHWPDGRYATHTLLRQYTAEKLAASPSAQEEAARRHAVFYMDFLAAQGSGEEANQRAAIRAELANIRAAWQWVAEKRDLETLERVAATLHNFYSAQSWFQEGIDAFQFALDQLADQPAATSGHAPALCDPGGSQILLASRRECSASLGRLGLSRHHYLLCG
jgi:DNA-binding SARP family transcriptional activator/predicted ATPase